MRAVPIVARPPPPGSHNFSESTGLPSPAPTLLPSTLSPQAGLRAELPATGVKPATLGSAPTGQCRIGMRWPPGQFAARLNSQF